MYNVFDNSQTEDTLIRCNTLQLRHNHYYICIIDNELSIYLNILTLKF